MASCAKMEIMGSWDEKKIDIMVLVSIMSFIDQPTNGKRTSMASVVGATVGGAPFRNR